MRRSHEPRRTSVYTAPIVLKAVAVSPLFNRYVPSIKKCSRLVVRCGAVRCAWGRGAVRCGSVRGTAVIKTGRIGTRSDGWLVARYFVEWEVEINLWE